MRSTSAAVVLAALPCVAAGCPGPPTATVVLDVEASPAIPTALHVTLILDADGGDARADAAWVELGLDAPGERVVAADAADDGTFRATVVGLKAGRDYLLRGVVETGAGAVSSETVEIATEPPPAALPSFDLTVAGEGPAPVVVTSLLGAEPAAVAVDGDGDYVWWYLPGTLDPGGQGLVTRAVPSADGRSMWVAAWTPLDGFGPSTDDRSLLRVALDGSEAEVVGVAGLHHDVCELPDGTVAALVFDEREVDGVTLNGDALVEIAPDGSQRALWSTWDDFDPTPEDAQTPGAHWSHANAVDWDEARGVYRVSLRNLDALVEIDREGHLVWQFGGQDGDVQLLSGRPATHQHQHQGTDGGLLVFDNGEDGVADSRAVEYAVDRDAGTAEQVWELVPDPGLMVYALGDVARLAGGSTVVTWATAGRIQQVDPAGDTLWQLDLSLGAGLGYTTLWDGL